MTKDNKKSRVNQVNQAYLKNQRKMIQIKRSKTTSNLNNLNKNQMT